MLLVKRIAAAVRWRVISRRNRVLWVLRRSSKQVFRSRLYRALQGLWFWCSDHFRELLRRSWLLRRRQLPVFVTNTGRQGRDVGGEAVNCDEVGKSSSSDEGYLLFTEPNLPRKNLALKDGVGSAADSLQEVNEICRAFGFDEIPKTSSLNRYQRRLRGLVRRQQMNFGRERHHGQISWVNRAQLLKFWKFDATTFRNSGPTEFFFRVANSMRGLEETSPSSRIGSDTEGFYSSVSPWSKLMSEISSTFQFDISVVLATKRKEQINFALSQITPQRNCRIELVVACHGFAAKDVMADLEKNLGRQSAVATLKVIEAPAEESFGSVLNRASLSCTSRYLTKWDDDDYYGSRHLIGLYVALASLGADFIGRPANFVELERLGTILMRRAAREFACTRVIAGGTIFSRTASLYGAGGWGNLSSGVDKHLLKNAVRRGFRVHSADANSFVLVRKPEGHTWDASEAYFYAASTHEMPTNFRQRILEEGFMPLDTFMIRPEEVLAANS